ncbi:DNA repair protein RecO [Omnitrophica bacterium]|nr:DNA repair protein RecO [Candidatus Omnitrophota bacterium]
MAIQKTEAFVLKTMPFRSSSMIGTFFTRDFGKVRGLAKGVRDERQARAASFELFTRLELVYYEKTRSDLHLVSDFFVLDSYGALRSRLESITYASYFSELLDKVCEIHDPHPELFGLLEFSFRFLSSLPGERLSRIFEVKLLNEIGWLPFLSACLECGNPHLEQGYFSVRQGALVCPACRSKYPDAFFFGPEALKAVRHYIGHSLQEAVQWPLSSSTEAELEKLMTSFFNDRLDYPLKSRSFLDRIKPVLT